MAAIDLLFRAKKDSERLHQLVLGTLLGRTRLLARLLPLREHQQPDLGSLQWEPEGNLSSSQLAATGGVLQLGRVGVLDLGWVRGVGYLADLITLPTFPCTRVGGRRCLDLPD